MAAVGMDPLNAPLPTAASFPFQLAAGAQTSIAISDSGVGLTVATTRQNAGSPRYGAVAPPPAGANVPAAITRADAMVTRASDIDARLSHASGDA